ncbi:MAG: methyltransferase [Acidobacteriia bacterium]|nr:methyltransferase [Terriglobia bacterium]
MAGFQTIWQGRTVIQTPEQAPDALILLFMDGEYVDRGDLERLLPPGAPAAMKKLGLLAADSARPERCFAPCALFPAEGLLLVSDRVSSPDHSPIALRPDAVYPASIENTALFMSTLPTTSCDALLDIGTGTGVAALAGARSARHAWGTDIAGRSVSFAEFNRRLNGIENAAMLEGDLYAPVEGLTFDRIVTHPPYVPARKTTMIFRDGGEDGEQVIRRVIEGLPRFLRPGGRFYSLVTAADCEGQLFEDRIREWLGEAAPEFDLVLVSYKLTLPRDVTATSLINRNAAVDDVFYRQEVWERRRAQFIFYGSVMLRRHAEARPAVTARVQKGESFAPRLADWLLEWQAETSAPAGCEALLDSRPLVSPHAELTVSHRIRDGRFVPESFVLRSAQPFEAECYVKAWLAQIVSQCDGRKTWREHFEAARRAGLFDQEASPAEFVSALAPLVMNGLLWVDTRPMPGLG